MKVLLVNTNESTGGAAIACQRLMSALQKANIEVKLLVKKKYSDNPDIIEIEKNRWIRYGGFLKFAWERLVIFVHNRFSKKNLFTVSIANTGTDISRMKEVQEADIIHLHWINQGLLSVADIQKLTDSGKPVVWTMHDMWPCTGICHHARLCQRYKNHCGHCPFLASNSDNDLSAKVFQQKKQWNFSRISFVACSQWLQNQARQSGFLQHNHISAIPNPIDIRFWKPQPKQQARKIFGFPENRKLLLFAAANASDTRKGISYLYDALAILADKNPELIEKTGLIILGKHSERITLQSPFPIFPIGYTSDMRRICNLYSAADLFVTPSLEENLPNTIMEAMSCGCPAAGFSVGGIPEMIDHLKNGYAALYRSAEDLAQGIKEILFSENYAEYSKQARMKVEQTYAEELVSQQYIHLYKKLLNIESQS